MGFPNEYQTDLDPADPDMLHQLAEAIAKQNVRSADWRDHLKTARAALHVLRNPTKEMLDNQIDEVSWRRMVDRWLEGK